MVVSVSAGLRPDDAPPRLIDQHAVDDRLHLASWVATCCRRPLLSRKACGSMPRTICCGALDQGVQFLIGTDVEIAKPAEKLGQVGDGRIAEDFALTFACAEPFGQMLDQLGEFGDKRLLGQLTACSKRAATRAFSCS